MKNPIGIFDSGYGGLTVLRAIEAKLPEYDFVYLGDNARAPYGTRAFQTIYEYTLEAVTYLFKQGCPLVILACNTASARALRTIQQRDLPQGFPTNRVLGIIRPTAEVIGRYSQTNKVGVLGTPGTIKSDSYVLEIHKQSPQIEVFQHACPLWVPIVENGATKEVGTQLFVQRDLRALLDQDAAIDTILLGCTHYPLLLDAITAHTPEGITILSQGDIVAASLKSYLQRHPEMDRRLSKRGKRTFLTTGCPDDFSAKAEDFYGKAIETELVRIDG